MQTKLKDYVVLLLSIIVGLSTCTAMAAELESLDTYRLWRVRDAAMKQQDARAIEKSVEVANTVRTRKDWTPQQLVELRDLIGEMERRESLSPVVTVPPELKELDYPFAVPRCELLRVRFAKADGAEANLQSLDVYTPATGSGHPVVVWLNHVARGKAGPLKTWYCPKIVWGEKVLFSFRPLAGLSGRNARFGINTTS